MRVLILGSGGREHAVAWKLKGDDPRVELSAAPGNPGIAELARCFPISATDRQGVLDLAERIGPDMVFVGPEAPLAEGVSDALRARGFVVFGPSQAAARLESSKRFSKQVMLEHDIPTAGASWHRDASQAKVAVRVTGAPVVIKASGLAAGKGVVVAQTIEEADRAIDDFMLRRIHGAAGVEILVEEFMEGEELSLFAVTDGKGFVLLPAAQDHKRLKDGDRGPNTGGMGAYAPVSLATDDLLNDVSERVIGPTLRAMERAGAQFSGLLYCGLMLTVDGPKVVEFNCRFGDPETQVILPLIDESLADLMFGAATGALRKHGSVRARQLAAVTTVVASPGYPETPFTGAPLAIPEHENGVVIFHAGTKRAPSGELLSGGGRVLAVTGVDADFSRAQQLSRSASERVVLEGAQFRRDIGWRESERRARVTRD